jgi:hypothetical protein
MPLWIIATALSYSIGGFISGFVTDYIAGDLGVWSSFAVMSMTMGMAQWLVIRKQLKKQLGGMGWLWATLIGGTVGGRISMMASFQLAIIYGDAIDLVAIYACLRGMSTGLAQWFLLRKRFNHAEWWIVATTVSWYASVMLGRLLIRDLGYFLTLTVGAVYGLLTGIMFLLLFSD